MFGVRNTALRGAFRRSSYNCTATEHLTATFYFLKDASSGSIIVPEFEQGPCSKANLFEMFSAVGRSHRTAHLEESYPSLTEQTRVIRTMSDAVSILLKVWTQLGFLRRRLLTLIST